MLKKIVDWFKEKDKMDKIRKSNEIKKYKRTKTISIARFRCFNCNWIWDEELKEKDKPFIAGHWRGSFIVMYTNNPERDSGNFLRCPNCGRDECKLIYNIPVDGRKVILIKDASIQELSEQLNNPKCCKGEVK